MVFICTIIERVCYEGLFSYASDIDKMITKRLGVVFSAPEPDFESDNLSVFTPVWVWLLPKEEKPPGFWVVLFSYEIALKSRPCCTIDRTFKLAFSLYVN